MSLSKDEIVRLVEEHEAQCRRQPQERDWRGNPVGSGEVEEPSALVEDSDADQGATEGQAGVDESADEGASEGDVGGGADDAAGDQLAD